MKTFEHASLAPYTSFECGGPAEKLIICEDYDDAKAASAVNDKPWLLGFGCNVLISDEGLPGTTLAFRAGAITQTGNTLIADAGVWWDDLVLSSIQKNLWGLEMMSAIPGGVAAAVVGNIAAYGQAVSDTLDWIEVYDSKQHVIHKMQPQELGLTYRFSALQHDAMRHLIILRAAFELSSEPAKELTYQSALDVANKKGYDINTLLGRRYTILGAREVAGSLWDYRESAHHDRTAGSFFRNPLVTPEQAERIISYDETGKSADLIKKMNQVHGGNSLRVSAAHVLLAAGFKRGQSWGNVRLHPQHILKIENVGNASAQEIYDVSEEIITTVKQKIGIVLTPEVRFLGTFM